MGPGPVISSPLSTAALRLLKEYGLRYGVVGWLLIAAVQAILWSETRVFCADVERETRYSTVVCSQSCVPNGQDRCLVNQTMWFGASSTVSGFSAC